MAQCPYANNGKGGECKFKGKVLQCAAQKQCPCDKDEK